MKRVLFWFAVSTILAVAATLMTTSHRRPLPGTEVGDRGPQPPEPPPSSSPEKEVLS